MKILWEGGQCAGLTGKKIVGGKVKAVIALDPGIKDFFFFWKLYNTNKFPSRPTLPTSAFNIDCSTNWCVSFTKKKFEGNSKNLLSQPICRSNSLQRWWIWNAGPLRSSRLFPQLRNFAERLRTGCSNLSTFEMLRPFRWIHRKTQQLCCYQVCILRWDHQHQVHRSRRQVCDGRWSTKLRNQRNLLLANRWKLAIRIGLNVIAGEIMNLDQHNWHLVLLFLK